MVKRGQIWWAEPPEPQASEPGYRRPVIIVQADEFTASRLNTVIVVAVTSNLRLAEAPGNVKLKQSDTGLSKESVANVSQILTLDKTFLTEQVGQLSRPTLQQIEDGLLLVLGIS